MKRKVLLQLLLVLSSAVSARAAPVLDPAAVSETTLDNGLRVIVKEAHTWPVVAVGVVVKAGSLYEGDYPAGTARFVAHLLFDSERGSSRLRPALTKLGGVVQSGVLRDSVNITFMAYGEVIPESLSVLAEGLFEASITEEEIARTRLELRELGRRWYPDPFTRLSQMLWEMACGNHPYANPTAGAPEGIEQISIGDVIAFYERFYVPNNVAVIAVGDVQAQEFFQQVQEAFGGYPGGDVEWQAPSGVAAPTEPRIKSDRHRVPFPFVGMAWQAPGITNKRDVCAMDLVYTLLQAGPNSLLAQTLQPSGDTERLALHWQVEFITHKQPGLLQIMVQAAPEKELEVRQALLEIINGLREQPVSEQRLTAAKQIVYAEYCFHNESYDEQLATLAFYEAIDSYQFALDYIDQVNAITPNEVQLVAQKYLAPAAYNLAILRPQVSDSLEARIR